MGTALKRSIESQIKKDLKKKIVLVAGPRQCGKTTLARGLIRSYDYFNYDSHDDRAALMKKTWDRKKSLIVFDELHKMPKWKSWLKGVYDTEGIPPGLLVTGSARLDTFRRSGDSLAGRHFYIRLHPFDLKEIASSGLRLSLDEAFQRLLTVGGYPEPFLSGDILEYRRWRQGHLDVILKQDLLDLETIRDLRSIELLVHMLRSKVGSTISVNALANELQKDHKTVSRWLSLLEELFLIFRVSPYAKDIARSVKKEPKYYFFDTGYVDGDSARRLENLVACALLKEAHYMTDVIGSPYNLHFLKIKGGREIDFLLKSVDGESPSYMIEVKHSDAEASPNFRLFVPAFKNVRQIQLVAELKREHTTSSGIEVRRAVEWLASMKI